MRIYDSGYRGDCPLEGAEQATFFNKLRKEYPDTYGALAFHAKNEGKKSQAQASRDRAQGLTTGTSDIIIPGAPAFVCELKRQDKTKSRISKPQLAYLEAAHDAGCFSCIAYGWEQAWQAFEDFRRMARSNSK